MTNGALIDRLVSLIPAIHILQPQWVLVIILLNNSLDDTLNNSNQYVEFALFLEWLLDIIPLELVSYFLQIDKQPFKSLLAFRHVCMMRLLVANVCHSQSSEVLELHCL